MFDLVPDVLSADLHGVIPGDFREVIRHLVGVVDLREEERIGPDCEGIEIQRLDTGVLREALLDTLGPARDALVRETDSHASFRNAKRIVQAGIAELGLVNHVRAKCLGVT